MKLKRNFWLSILIALVLVFFVGCGSKSDTQQTTVAASEEALVMDTALESESETLEIATTQVESSTVETEVETEAQTESETVKQTEESSQEQSLETQKSETAKAETTKAKSKKKETTKAETTKAKSKKKETTKAETTKAKSKKKETTKAETTKAKSTKKETTKAETKKVETTKAEATTKEQKLTCTISIECSTILKNKDDLKKSKEEFVPSDGWILKKTKVEFEKGESVHDILQRVCKEKGIQMESSFTPAYNSAYVEGINQLYEFDCGQLSGWMYEVNGTFPNYGCSAYEVSDGDVIGWHYTCDLGTDVGDTMN